MLPAYLFCFFVCLWMVSLLRGINIEVAIVLLQNSEDRYSVIIRRPSLSF